MAILKRGIFYTLGAFFLASIVLVLAALVSISINQSNERLAEAGGFERIIALDDSILNIIRDLDNGITISVEDSLFNNELTTRLLIVETLNKEYSDYNQEFLTKIEDLANYVESDQPEIEFDLSKLDSGNEKIKFTIEPHNLIYTHVKDNSSNRTIIKVIPPGSLTNANISINLDEFDNNLTDILTWTQQAAGAFNLSVTVTDNYNYSETEVANIDLNSNNTFLISAHGRQAQVKIGDLCQACIKIDKGDFNITSSFSTELEDLGETVTANYPSELYTITFENLGIYINKTPRIV